MVPNYFVLIINTVLKCLEIAFLLQWHNHFSKTEDRHLKHTKHVFDCLSKVHIKLEMCKCNFFKAQIHYLGDMTSEN